MGRCNPHPSEYQCQRNCSQELLQSLERFERVHPKRLLDAKYNFAGVSIPMTSKSQS